MCALFGAAFFGTLLALQPVTAPTTVSEVDTPVSAHITALAVHRPESLVIGAESISLPVNALREDELPERFAAAYAEPALLDLLEDAASPDPRVRAEARHMLQDRELLSAPDAVSTEMSLH